MSHSVWVQGLSGRVGQVLAPMIQKSSEFSLAGGASQSTFTEAAHTIEEADLIIDFSSAEGSEVLAEYIKKNPSSAQKSFLICSTGLKKETLDFWTQLPKAEPKARVLIAPNTSLGILLTRQAALSVAEAAKKVGFDFVLEETHHRYKKDAPSGTALYLAGAVGKKAGLPVVTDCDHEKNHPSESLHVHASRGGGVFGEHSLRLISDSEEITISHRAFSRDLFAKGALFLGKWLLAQKGGVYSPENVSL